MYNYNVKKLLEQIEEIFSVNLKADEIQWLCDKSYSLATTGNTTALLSTFSATPRYTGKRLVVVSEQQQTLVDSIKKDFTFRNYTTDQLGRLWLLLHFPVENEEHYIHSIDLLFSSAEMNELVALYSSLPLLASPDRWKFRCTEGIRSNIGSVLESVICNNPYPAQYLDEGAWNQLVLKAFFTEKPVNQIMGLDSRANQKLADTLRDYANERWAAGRLVNPLLWRLVAPFIDDSSFNDIVKAFNGRNDNEKIAAALACSYSTYPPAIELLNSEPQLKSAIERKEITWQTIADSAGI